MNPAILRQCGRMMTTKVDAQLSQMHTTTAGDVKKDGPTPDLTSDVNDPAKPVEGDLSEKIVLVQEKVMGVLKDIECKLPIWQTKISNAMQSVQDFISSKFTK